MANAETRVQTDFLPQLDSDYPRRLIIPMAAAASGILDFCIAFVVLLALMVYYGYWPAFDIPTLLKILWLPIFVALTLVTALGTGLWLSALNVQFRDVRYVI